MKNDNIKIIQASNPIGAFIEGVQLSEINDEVTINKIYEAFLKYQVIFFRNQNLTETEYLTFAKKIGKPIMYPFVKGLEKFPEIIPILKKKTDVNNFGGIWHSDTSYLNEPPKGTMLYAIELPKKGGDTEFSNQYLAYENLSDDMKVFLNNKTALNISGKEDATKTRSDLRKHSSTEIKSDELKAIHPVIRTHPETKKQSLYINIAHTQHFTDMSIKESVPILEFLFNHQIKYEFTYRFKWEKGSIAIWDNRCTLHNPINDYHGERRLMHRITFQGGKPIR
jgi:taurine dioxygenase